MAQITLTSQVAEQLGKNVEGIKGIFSCSGTITLDQLQLFYKKEASTSIEAQFLSFPCSKEALEPLLKLCEPASFGRGYETVLDKSYRDALHLNPSSFGINFSPSHFGLLEQVKRYMMPDNVIIREELYKLNVYGPNGHFKSHVDTPREGGMFGSLVVCLPVEFEGGQLVVQHRESKNIFDWSSTQPYEDVKVQWAAFFSDCEHSIETVTSGYRLTLTYNLYALEDNRDIGDSISGFCSESLSFYQALKGAIANPAFMASGGILGFGLQHAYPIKDKPNFKTKFHNILKGTDAMLYVVAKKLGLKHSVVPVYPLDADEAKDYEKNCRDDQDMEVDDYYDDSDDDDDSDNAEVVDDDDNDDAEVDDAEVDYLKMQHQNKSKKVLYVARPGDFPRKNKNSCYNPDQQGTCEMIKEDHNGRRRKDITWCVLPLNLVESNAYFAQGNDCCMTSVYLGAAMLVTISCWGEGNRI